jgi:hypothetical protein
VIGAKGHVQPCFFISGPPDAQILEDLPSVLNSGGMPALREDIRSGIRAECRTCVCSMWRDLDVAGTSTRPPRFALEAST